MCGIAGVINGGDRYRLERMADVQRHRGPDDGGIIWFEESRTGLAHRRLSILDLSEAGHQPMCNATGRRWISFNGEIYNYRELRAELSGRGHSFRTETDTEVILAAYDEWGIGCLERFNGMFAFAIYDTERREMLLARDHLGIKPLYYAQRGDTFAFASEAKAIFELEEFSPVVNPNAVISSLLLLWVPEPETGYQGLLKLEAGHYAIINDDVMRVGCYWDLPICDSTQLPRRSEADYVEELRELLLQAIRRQMIADVPVGAFLSGGLDSSLVVALMRQVTSGPISTYTIGFNKSDLQLEAMPDDARYAAQVARHFSTDHREIEASIETNDLLPKLLWHLDDPVADGAAINTYLIARGAKEAGTTVLLNGMGGDEVFGGYRKQLATLMIERYRKLPRLLRESAIAPLVERLPVSLAGRGLRLPRWAKRFVRGAELEPIEAFTRGFAYFTPEGLREILDEPWRSIPFDELYPIRRYREMAARVEGLPLIDQMTWLDTKLFMPGLNLIYSDKAAMAASVETRPPLIDKEIVEFMARVPGAMKINGRTQKYLLKRAAEAWLPKEIIYRRKAAFGTPIRAWMKRGLDREVRRTFVEVDLHRDGFIRSAGPLRLLAEHGAGREDNAHKLWGLYTTIAWTRQAGVASTEPIGASGPV